MTTLFFYPSYNPIARWVVVLPFALATTLALLVLMQQLIFQKFEEIEEMPSIEIPEIYWEDQKIIEIVDNQIKKPEPPSRPPEAPEQPEQFSGKPEFGTPSAGYVHNPKTNLKIGMDSRMPVAQVLISPKYPNSAINRGLEGFVDVQFDISAEGITENIQVNYAEPPGIFEKSAVNAVKRWRYLPQLDSGKAVPYIGLVQRIRFQMKNSN